MLVSRAIVELLLLSSSPLFTIEFNYRCYTCICILKENVPSIRFLLISTDDTLINQFPDTPVALIQVNIMKNKIYQSTHKIAFSNSLWISHRKSDVTVRKLQCKQNADFNAHSVLVLVFTVKYKHRVITSVAVTLLTFSKNHNA